VSRSTDHPVICLSSQRWDEPTWTNKQHIMSRLAKNHRVLHVDFGGLGPDGWVRQLATHAAGQRLQAARTGIIHREGTLWTGQTGRPWGMSRLPVPNRMRDYFSFRKPVNLARRFMADRGIEDGLVWAYHPGFGTHVDSLPRKLLIYDCVDDYSAFPELQAHAEWLEAREKALCEAADLVFCTSSTLYELKKGMNPETHMVHNVGDADHFVTAMDPALEVAPEISALRGPIVTFVGAVSDYKLNVDWILAAAKARPDWQIVLIGPVGIADPSTNVGELKRCKNVHLLGTRAYAELPRYLKGSDVTVIPYRINRYTRSVFPIKFFEFLATGKPVVISNLPACSDYYDSVLVADSAETFIERCDEALALGDAGSEARVALAKENSWPKRIGAILGHIDRKLGER
jgi:glycosyltransferase involved in cell wall biosynthesis